MSDSIRWIPWIFVAWKLRELVKSESLKPFSVWCPLKGHTYLNKPNDTGFERFSDINIEISNDLASFKKKCVGNRGNQAPFKNIDRSKATMTRFSLSNSAFKKLNQRSSYRKFCLSIIWTSKNHANVILLNITWQKTRASGKLKLPTSH